MKRNDVKAAIEAAAKAMDDGSFGPDAAQVLLGLQDDPTAYIEAFEELVDERRASKKPVPVFLDD